MPLHAALSDRTLRLELDEPERGNAFGRSTARALAAALRLHDGRFEDVVLSASGRFFCTGGDLADHAKMTDAREGRAANREIAAVLDLLAAVPRPTLAVIQGDCLGGGLELASCFDRVVTVPEAAFGFWQRRMGLSFGWGGGARLGRRLTPHLLRRLATEAVTLTAHEALAIGLVDRIVLAARLEEDVADWIARLRAWPGALGRRSGKGFLQSERIVFESLWWGPEHRARLSKRASSGLRPAE